MENKKIYVNNLEVGIEVVDFFVIKAISIKTGSNNKNYMDLILGDNSGEVNCKKWELSDFDISLADDNAIGTIVKIAGQVSEWNGQKQLKINRIRKAVDADGMQIMEFVKSSPENPEEMYKYIISQVDLIKDNDIKNLVLHILNEFKEKMMYYPAALRLHHSEYGGLLYHIKRMLMSGVALCEIYRNLNKDLVVAGIVLHDIQKINEINSTELGIATEYSFEGQMLGHIVQGIKHIDKVAMSLGVPNEKMIMLEHMILSHHYEPEFGSPKKPLFPEAEILHHVDMIDAKMYDMEQALRDTGERGFTDKIWSLDNRKLYKASSEFAK